jgi:hypothetical protein
LTGTKHHLWPAGSPEISDCIQIIPKFHESFRRTHLDLAAKWREMSAADYGASTAPAAAHEQTDSSDGACLMLQVMPLSELVLHARYGFVDLAVVLHPA